MFGLPEKIVIFDVECTTWEGALARNWSGPGEHRELVQLGAALVETNGFIELASFQRLVKPVKNPVLSQYFVDLTHITQEMVDKDGVDFKTFLRDFKAFCLDYELCSFDKPEGSRIWDRDVLVENCDLYGIEPPFRLERFHNVNLIFYQHGYHVGQSGAAPEAFGLAIPARPHDALNDVRGLIIGLRALSERIGSERIGGG